MSDFFRPFVGPFILVAILALLAVLTLGILRIGEWSRPEPSGPTGTTKRIRVSNTKIRNDLPVFITKEALKRYLLAFNRGDTDTIVFTLAADTFPVDDYTHVRILDYDPAGNGLYRIEVLEGPKQSRVAWVMGMDLRD